MDPKVRAAIAAISEDAWTAGHLPAGGLGRGPEAADLHAEVAEATYTAFTSKKGQAITARLIVRRVKDLNRKASQGQDELFTIWRYHAVFTELLIGIRGFFGSISSERAACEQRGQPRRNSLRAGHARQTFSLAHLTAGTSLQKQRGRERYRGLADQG